MKTMMMALLLLLALPSHGQAPGFFLNDTKPDNSPGIISDKKVDDIICGDNLTIKDHMGRMQYIIRSLRDLVDDIVKGKNTDEVRAVLMVDSQVLRTHLIAVLPKTPQKIIDYDPHNIQKNKIIFQRYLQKMVGFTLDIEEELLRKPIQPEEIQAQQLKLASLIIKIDETVAEAHDQFRH